jgi:NitT/TauT family transport system permease protein
VTIQLVNGLEEQKTAPLASSSSAKVRMRSLGISETSRHRSCGWHGGRRVFRFLGKYVSVWLLLAVWEVAPRLGLVDPVFVPPFSSVMATVWELRTTSDLLHHVGISLFRALAGFLLAVLVALPLGFLLGGWFPCVEAALSPLADVFSQANPFILFHIILLFLGIGEATKVTIIAWACVWPILFSTIAAIRHIDPVLKKTAAGFGLSRVALFWKVVLPATAPSLFTSLRLSAGYAFFMLIAAEMMGASSGLGWLVLSYQENYHVVRIFAVATVIAVLGLGIDGMMRLLERLTVVQVEPAMPRHPGEAPT